ncbi:Rad9-domain-containing protein [Pseudomassariella vexata]|uniref:DNA repair protein rad9 n=1 Tax=Pseudomassariella vexata TaxID=1141098 RepID=A0A1Y2EAB1_9PEZI|nr:Rad9-domain-containing protein [Pseudomassariella vexata]ORY68503.1 Rad9-domain-containing protein [Pseudomassariella vexata]
MTLLRFTLSEEGVGAFRDALACLNKFSDEVSLEAKRDKLVFTALNSSKSAYACFSFATNRFFSRYHYEGAAHNRDKFFCKLYNRALLSLFRARSGDPLHMNEKDTTIERCDVAIEDEAGKKSRFIVKITCRNGMTTKYQLPFEVSPPVHAKFDNEEATNHWSMSSRTLRQLMDHFGPGIEFLDIHSEDDQVVNFTCFTEKVANGDEVLKKPLHTSIAVERDEFEDFEVAEDKLHIVISVKDFRAIIQHAAFLGNEITAYYSMPSRPMQLRYDGDGVQCDFLLMTVGERGAPGQQRTKRSKANAKVSRQQQLESATSRATSHAPTPAPQPIPAPRQVPMPSLRPSMQFPSQRPPPPAFDDDDSLFVPQDNDNQWDPVNVNEEDDEEENARLEWGASAQPVRSPLRPQSALP